MKIGDFVARKKYGMDIVFKIEKIKEGIYYLKGVYTRLYADSLMDDLVLVEEEMLRSLEDENKNYRTKIEKEIRKKKVS